MRPTLTKPSTNFNPNLDPKPKVALTLLHLNDNHIQKHAACMESVTQ